MGRNPERRGIDIYVELIHCFAAETINNNTIYA